MKAKAPRHVQGELRREILEASLALIVSEGVGALSMREVARRAGVTHGAPYFHFADRGAILAAIAEEGLTMLGQEMRAARDALTDPVERFKVCGSAYVRFALAHVGHFRVMLRPELADPADHPNLRLVGLAALEVLVEAVAECQAAGLARHHEPMDLVLTSWSTAHGLAALLVDGPLARGTLPMEKDPERLIASVARTLGSLLAGT